MKKTLKVAWQIISANPRVRKATNALGVTLVGGFGTALLDGGITWAESGAVLGVALVATSAVWKGDNKDPESQQNGLEWG